MENKKTKLTISGKSKKPIENFDSSKAKGKKTVFIDKTNDRFVKKINRGKSPSTINQSPNFKRGPFLKPNQYLLQKLVLLHWY